VAVRCLFRWGGGGGALGRRKQRFKGAAAGSVRLKKKQRGIFGNVGLMRVLRFLSSKLDRILSGLFSKPIRRRERACFSPKPIRRRKDITLGLVDPEAGLGLPGLDSGSFGLDFGLVDGSGAGLYVPVSGSSACSHSDLMQISLVSPRVVDEQFRLKGGRRPVAMVFGGIEDQSRLASPVSSTGSVKSDGVSDTGSVVASGHADEGAAYSSSAGDGLASCASGSEDSLVGLANASDGSVPTIPSGSVSVPIGEGSTGSISMVSVECKSPGFAKNELIGAVTVAKPLAVSARKETQAWFIGWLRAGVQHDEKLLAKLDVIVKRTSRVKLDALYPDRTTDLLRKQEELASMDVESRQVVATSSLNLQAQE
jgi:hypothetical protein